MFKVLMTKVSTNESHVLYRDIPTENDANGIVGTMNRLNEFTAKVTGKAVVFMYKVMTNES